MLLSRVFTFKTSFYLKKVRLFREQFFIQAALPTILNETPESWHREQNEKLFIGESIFCTDKIVSAAKMLYNGLEKAPGLHPIMPSGAMYMMVWLSFYSKKKSKLSIENPGPESTNVN